MRQPIQVLSLSPNAKFLALAWANVLQIVNVESGGLVFTSSSDGKEEQSHKAGTFIRHLVWWKEEKLLSSAEDKVVKEWKVNEDGTLELKQERDMLKKVNSMQITEDGKHYVIADKFGDVYTFPLSGHTSSLPVPPTATFASTSSNTFEASSSTTDIAMQDKESARVASASGKRKKGNNKNQDWRHVDPRISSLTPLLGHVSLLTAVLLCEVDDDEKKGEKKQLIVTADRDEHIRVSKWPESWEVEGFLLGQKKFVSCLLIHPHSPSVLISGGGDDDLRLWDLSSPSYPCLSKGSISVEVLKGTAEINTVSIEPPKAGRQTQRRARKKAEKKAIAAQQGKEEMTGSGPDENGSEMQEIEGTESMETSEQQSKQEEEKKYVPKTRKLDLAIRKMVWLGTKPRGTTEGEGEKNGVLIISGVGSSSLLIYSAASLLPNASSSTREEENRQMLKFNHPILDITSTEGGSLLWISLDLTSINSANADEPTPSSESILCYTLSAENGKLVPLSSHPTLSTLNSSCSQEVSEEAPYPKSETLYPEIAMFSKDPAELRKAGVVGGFDGEEEEGDAGTPMMQEGDDEEELREVKEEEERERERAEKKVKLGS